MKRLMVVVSLLLMAASSVFAASVLYRFQNEKGAFFVTDDYMSIPEQYHSTVTVVANGGTDTRYPAYSDRGKGNTKSTPAALQGASERKFIVEQPPAATTPLAEPHGAVAPEGDGSWMSLHQAELKTAGIVVLAVVAFILLGKVLSAAPRLLSLVLKCVLAVGLATYLLKGNTDKLAKIFDRVKEEGNVVEKAAEKRRE